LEYESAGNKDMYLFSATQVQRKVLSKYYDISPVTHVLESLLL